MPLLASLCWRFMDPALARVANTALSVAGAAVPPSVGRVVGIARRELMAVLAEQTDRGQLFRQYRTCIAWFEGGIHERPRVFT